MMVMMMVVVVIMMMMMGTDSIISSGVNIHLKKQEIKTRLILEKIARGFLESWE